MLTADFFQLSSTLIQAISLIFLIVYVIKTWEMASATRRAAEETAKSVLEMREAREQQTSPYVIAYFDVDVEHNILYLVVKNIGATVAENIKIVFSPELETSNNDFRVKNVLFLQNGMKSMPPNYSVRTIIDSISLFLHKEPLPIYEVRISYTGGINKSERVTELTLDLSSIKGIVYIKQNSLEDLSGHLHDIKKILADSRNEIRSIQYALNDGIYVTNSIFPVLDLTTTESKIMALIQSKLKELLLLWQLYSINQDSGIGAERFQKRASFIKADLTSLFSLLPIKNDENALLKLRELVILLNDIEGFVWFMGEESINKFNSLGDQLSKKINLFLKLDKE